MECLGDGGGDEEHPVQVRAGFAQRFACDKVPCNCSIIFIPLQRYIQIDAFTATVVSGAEDIRVPRDLPAILPVTVHEKILVWQVPHTLQTVLQLLKDFLSGTLAGVLLPPGIFRGRFPAGQFNSFHSHGLLVLQLRQVPMPGALLCFQNICRPL